jgi:hypothetical protein
LKKLLLIFIILYTVLNSGCANRSSVIAMPNTTIDTSEKSFVFLTKSRWNINLGYELKKLNFDVSKQIRYTGVNVKESPTVDKQYADYSARYGIEIEQGGVSNWCMVNDNINTMITAEITDLKTNEVLFIIEESGWTGDCAYHSGDLFGNIARNIKRTWDLYGRNTQVTTTTTH